jgi:transcriptional regulator with XRE-family HTH domain
LRECRQSAELTQVEVAEKLQLTQSDISKVERGVRSIDILELRRWVDVLNFDFMSFISELDRRLSAIELLPRHWSRPPKSKNAGRRRR